MGSLHIPMVPCSVRRRTIERLALSILAASGQIDPQSLLPYEFLGELGLTGELRPVAGALRAAITAAEAGRILVVPPANAAEAALADHADVRVARRLLECCAGLAREDRLPRATCARIDPPPCPICQTCAGRPMRAAHWKWPLPVVTICC